MALVLLTQYFDTLKDIGTRGGQQYDLPAEQSRVRRMTFMTQILGGLRGSMNAGVGTAGLPVRTQPPPLKS